MVRLSPPTAGTRCPLLSLRTRVYHPSTCTYVRLLGPCFKTGRIEPFRQHRAEHFHLSHPRHTAPGLNTRTPTYARPTLPPQRRSVAQLTDADTCDTPRGAATTVSIRFPFSNFKSFALSFQSSLHLSLAVLVRYRSLAVI